MGRFVLLICWGGLLALPGWGHDLGSEETGPYYVNIAMVGNGMGAGFCDSFQAEVRPMIVSEAAQVEWLSDQDFFTAGEGVTYRFRQVGEQYQLYKFVTGRRPVRVQLYGLMLHPAKKQRYLLSMRAAVPDTYSSYELTDQLNLLGVLGATVQGATMTFDFVVAMTTPKGPQGDGFSDVVVTNVEVMLRRYAYQIMLDGLPLRPLNAGDRAPSANDPHGRYKYFAAVMAKVAEAPEQTLLDQCFNGSDNLFLGDATTAAALRAIPHRIADNALAPDLPLRCVYVSQRGRTATKHGSARACFVPVKVKQGDREFYPVYVFSSAFFSHQTLTAAILREYYHAQWWNAVAHLDRNDPGQARLREYLLRLPYPWLENDIYYGVNNGLGSDSGDSDLVSILFELNRVYLYQLTQALRNPRGMIGGQRLPWTQSVAIITPSLGQIDEAPSRLYDLPDAFYANAIWKTAQKLDDGKGRLLPLETIVGGNANTLPNPPLYEIQDTLLAAIASGYTRSASFRTERFRAAVTDLESEWDDLRAEACTKAAAPHELLDAAGAAEPHQAFTMNDLAWLQACCPRIATAQTFTQRLTALTAGAVKGADNLVPALYAEAIVNLNADRNAQLQADLEQLDTALDAFDRIKTDFATDDQQLDDLRRHVAELQEQADDLDDQIGNARTDLNNLATEVDQAVTACNAAMKRAMDDDTEENQREYREAYTRQRQAERNYTERANQIEENIRQLTEQFTAVATEKTALDDQVTVAEQHVRNLALSLQNRETELRGALAADTWRAQVRYLVNRFFRHNAEASLDLWDTLDRLRSGLGEPPPDLRTFP